MRPHSRSLLRPLDHLRALRRRARCMRAYHVRVSTSLAPAYSNSSGDVYIPAGTTQAALATNATTAVSFFPVLTPNCVNAILPYLCAAFFRPCDANGEVRPICPDVCAATAGNCSTTLAAPLVGGCTLLTDATGELVFQDGASLHNGYNAHIRIYY